MNILVAIIVFSLLIFFHELGHFTLAKLNGIRVNEFSLGLGPTIVGFTKGETTYSLKLLPFGGACMMEGEDENSEDELSILKNEIYKTTVMLNEQAENSLKDKINIKNRINAHGIDINNVVYDSKKLLVIPCPTTIVNEKGREFLPFVKVFHYKEFDSLYPLPKSLIDSFEYIINRLKNNKGKQNKNMQIDILIH